MKTKDLIKDKFVEVDVSSLKEHPKNYRKHPAKQLNHIVESIKTNGMYRNIVVARDNTILAGHGVVQACKKMKIGRVYVVRLNVASDSRKAMKILVGDNEIARLAVDDDRTLAEILKGLKEDDDLIGTGVDEERFAKLAASFEEDGADLSAYTQKIEAPVYTPMGDKPALTELVDRTKSRALMDEIEAAKIPADIKDFLVVAAERHNAFDYQAIAEFYAHAPKKIQRLMENSALVIIDFKKAVENGFVSMSKEIAALYPDEPAE